MMMETMSDLSESSDSVASPQAKSVSVNGAESDFSETNTQVK
jgi:hypothetical protein